MESQAEKALELIQRHIADGTAEEHGYSMFHYLEDVDVNRSSDDGFGIRFNDRIEFLLYSESEKCWEIYTEDNDE
jgi:hypothetical protein